MSFFSRLASEGHIDLVLGLRVEGIPTVFVEREVPVADTIFAPGLYSQVVAFAVHREGETSLDLQKRREIGATLEVELVDDTVRTLNTIFALNARRRGWVSGAFTAADVDIDLNSTSGLVAGDTIYIGTEAITVGVVASATSLTGCTRGAFGSTATALWGSATDGDSFYVKAPAWASRRAYLYGWVLHDGIAEEQLLSTWLIEKSPKPKGDLMWTLTMAGLAQEYGERAMAVGLRKQSPTAGGATPVIHATAGTVDVVVEDATFFRMGTDVATYVVVERRTADLVRAAPGVAIPINILGNISIHELAAVDVLAGTVTFKLEGAFGTRGLVDVDFLVVESIRPLAVVQGASPTLLLFMLLSKVGDQVANDYDVLPGREPVTTFDFGWRIGAGFALGEVDTESVALVPARPCAFMLDKEQKAEDVLREWMILNGCAWGTTREGKLRLFLLSSPRQNEALALTADDIVADQTPTIEVDEGAVSPLATVRCGYNPITAAFGSTLDLVDGDLARRYPRNQNRLQLELKSLAGDTLIDETGFLHPGTSSLAEIATWVADVQRAEGSLVRRFIKLSLMLARLSVEIGDVLSLPDTLPDAFTDLPDFEGANLGGAVVRVVGRRPVLDEARIEVTLQVLEDLWHICPACSILSVDATRTIITLDNTGPECSSATPEDDFYVGCGLRVYDVSTLGGGSPVVDMREVIAIQSGPSRLTIDAPLTAGIGATDYLILNPATSVAGTTASGYSLDEMATLAGDDGVGANATEPRWR